MDWPRLLDHLSEERPEIFLMGWSADYPDPDNFLRLTLSRLPIQNWNPAYEQLVEDARRITVQGQRIERYQQADRILIEEAALMPLSYGRWHLLVKPWVKQFPISPIVGMYLKDVLMESH